MSFELMAWAVKQRTGSAPRKAVLLALADRANQDTGLCCPTIARIAEQTELGQRTVQRALVDLEEAGLIARERDRRDDGSYGVWHYTLTATPPPARAAAGRARAAAGTTGQSGRSSNQEELPSNQELPSPAESAGKQRSNAVWDQLEALFGKPTTPPERTRRGKIVRDLVAATASFEPDRIGPEIARRADAYRREWPTAAFTETALWTRWSFFDITSEPPRTPRERAKSWIDTSGLAFSPVDATTILEDMGLAGDQLAGALAYHEQMRIDHAERQREEAG